MRDSTGNTTAAISSNVSIHSAPQPRVRNIAAAGARPLTGVLSAMLLSATLAGCASAPIPTEQLAVSQAAIERATTAGAPEHAPLEIKTARDKMTAAQRAIEAEEYMAAAALAEEAAVDAKLAETKAESEKAKKSVAELQDNLRTLMDEVRRNNQQQIQSEQQMRSGSGS